MGPDPGGIAEAAERLALRRIGSTTKDGTKVTSAAIRTTRRSRTREPRTLPCAGGVGQHRGTSIAAEDAAQQRPRTAQRHEVERAWRDQDPEQRGQRQVEERVGLRGSTFQNE
jgi:hypothetical protein